MIKVINVVKTFDGFRALDGLTMTAEKGSIYGLVGPNGAGKSTILRHIMGIYRPDSGSVLVDGSGVGDVGAVVLRDRKILAEDGMVVVILNLQHGQLLSEPEIITRGFIYVKESEELMRALKEVASSAAFAALGKGGRDTGELRGAVKSAVSGYLFKHTRRSPMVIPVVNRL